MSVLQVFSRSRYFVQQSVILKKLYHKLQPCNELVSNVEIEVPWGIIAGKLWGKPEGQPLLALHGWQDNAGSFDLLAPHLLENASVLAIDLPGHGASSWLPPGELYLDFTYLMTIHRLKNYFKWKKVKILAHSLSAQLSYLYTATFPVEVEFVIALDALKHLSIGVERQRESVRTAFTKLIEMEQTYSTPPKYKEEEMINRWITAAHNSIDRDACKILMRRGVKENEDGTYSFVRDPRLRLETSIVCGTPEQIEEMAKFITCPYLYICAEQSYINDFKDDERVIEIMKKNCAEFQTLFLPGTHHFHMIHAADVAKPINSFLQKYNK